MSEKKTFRPKFKTPYKKDTPPATAEELQKEFEELKKKFQEVVKEQKLMRKHIDEIVIILDGEEAEFIDDDDDEIDLTCDEE